LPSGWERWNLPEKQKLLDTLKRAEAARAPKDPAGWAAYRGIHFWSAQQAIAASVEASKRTVVRAGHSVGKSYEAAVLTCWWTDTHPGGIVVTTAPSVHQVHGILWEEIRALHKQLKLSGRAMLSDEWRVGDRLVAFGRKPPDAAKGSDFDPSTFQGFHRAGGVLVILDEAGGIPEWLWNAAETITTSDNSRILAIGNPDNPGSHFAKVCTPGHPGWAQHKISVFDSPNFTGENVPAEVAAALVTQLWEAERREEWGEDNPLYISKVLADFPSDHPNQVVPASALAACWIPEPRSPTELVPVELGVDVGGGGDLTVIRERCGLRAGRRWAQRTPEPEQAALLVLHAIHETGATSVKVDAIGVGWGLAGELRNMGRRGDHHARIHVVNVAEKASDPAKYANLRAQLWFEIGRLGSQRREWDLSVMEAADVTNGQLLMPRWDPDVKGRVQVEPKDDIRARTGGGSPDDADALLLAFHVPRSATQDYFDQLAGVNGNGHRR
jgi:hypothetical protein